MKAQGIWIISPFDPHPKCFVHIASMNKERRIQSDIMSLSHFILRARARIKRGRRMEAIGQPKAMVSVSFIPFNS